MTPGQLTANFAEKRGFHINQEQIDKLDIYANLLIEWNKK